VPAEVDTPGITTPGPNVVVDPAHQFSDVERGVRVDELGRHAVPSAYKDDAVIDIGAPNVAIVSRMSLTESPAMQEDKDRCVLELAIGVVDVQHLRLVVAIQHVQLGANRFS
jgi:hypothetical protein